MSFKLAVATASVCLAAEQTTTVNPIRKVVTMLQMMQKKVEAEGVKEKELFDKFMCYCRNSGTDLQKSISESESKVSSLPAEVADAEAQLAQLKEDLKKAQVDRSSAKAAMAEATAIRAKEAGSFSKESNDLQTNIAAIAKAVAALEKGMTGAFLQTQAASVLRILVENDGKMLDVDRDDLTSFLSGTTEYAPQSGQILGILKQMGDTMTNTLQDVTNSEHESIATYDALMKAKTAEVQALTASIEDKTQRIGEVGVKIVGLKQDLTDAEESLVDDKKFLSELDSSCATKEKDWQVICKTRSEELLALADTIKILNDDDALELFKKTLPGSASFIQVQGSSASLRSRALATLQDAKKNQADHRLDFIMLALRGKKVGFDKVITMIDKMVALLKEEQLDDNHKQEYCVKQFDFADDKKKGLERSVSKLETAIADGKETIASLTEDIVALGDSIADLDKAVVEATANRQEENSDFQNLVASNSAAKELLAFAKNRLNKFYNPKLYKAPPKRELSEDERITLNMGGTLAPTAAPGGIAGTGIAMLAQIRAHDAPPPPPETFGAYSKKSEEGGGVINMIDLLIKEIDTELTEAKTEEKLAQSEYEELMSDSAAKRAADSKSLTDKSAAKGDLEEQLTTLEDKKGSAVKELMATVGYISQLHAECDWLIKYFDVRKEARNGEIDSLVKAKAVLSGADFSLVQVRSAKFLTRA